MIFCGTSFFMETKKSKNLNTTEYIAILQFLNVRHSLEKVKCESSLKKTNEKKEQP